MNWLSTERTCSVRRAADIWTKITRSWDSGPGTTHSLTRLSRPFLEPLDTDILPSPPPPVILRKSSSPFYLGASFLIILPTVWPDGVFTLSFLALPTWIPRPSDPSLKTQDLSGGDWALMRTILPLFAQVSDWYLPGSNQSAPVILTLNYIDRSLIRKFWGSQWFQLYRTELNCTDDWLLLPDTESTAPGKNKVHYHDSIITDNMSILFIIISMISDNSN